MGSLPELRQLSGNTLTPPPEARRAIAPRYSFGASTGIQVRNQITLRPPLNIEGTSSTQGVTIQGRRRESCASSLGAASVRRLVRTGPLGAGGALATPENITFRGAIVICCIRAFAAAAWIPLQVLQGGQGLWFPGPPLLASLHIVSTGTALISPAIIHLMTIRRLIPTVYLILAIFFAAHLYPKVYVLVPVYLIAGACWSPLALAQKTLLTTLSDDSIRSINGINGVAGALPAKRALIRRLSRASRAARDFGLLMAAIVLPLLPSSSNLVEHNYNKIQQYVRNTSDCVMEYNNGVTLCKVQILEGNANESMKNAESWTKDKVNISIQPNATLETWSPTESEEELEIWRETWCGARGCPGQEESLPSATDELEAEAGPLAISLCICCALAGFCSLALPTTDAAAGPAPWRAPFTALSDSRLRLVGPLAFFIGLEQGFLYAHLMQWYVVCVSGAGQPWRALIGVALLRALVACTLSMLLAHGRRRVVVAVGVLWHSCLLLALYVWRAARADRQLPPVMAAAWAGCDAVWELVQASLVEEPWCGGLSALSYSFRAFGLAFSLLLRWLLCAHWTLKALMLVLPAAALPLLLASNE